MKHLLKISTCLVLFLITLSVSYAQDLTTISGTVRLPAVNSSITVLHVEAIGYDSNRIELTRTYSDGIVRVSAGLLSTNYTLNLSNTSEVTQYSVRVTCISDRGACDNIVREQHFSQSGLVNIFEADNDDLFIATADLPADIDFSLIAGGKTVSGNIVLDTPKSPDRRLRFIVNIGNDVNYDTSTYAIILEGEQSTSFKFPGLIDAIGHDHRITWVCLDCAGDYVAAGESGLLASGQDHELTLGVSQEGILLNGSFTLTEGFTEGELATYNFFNDPNQQEALLSVSYELIKNPDNDYPLKSSFLDLPDQINGLDVYLLPELQIPGNSFDHAVLMPTSLPALFTGEIGLSYYCQACIDSVVSTGYFTSQPSLPSATSQESLRALISAQESRSDLNFGLIYQYIPPPFETLVPSMLLLLDDQQP